MSQKSPGIIQSLLPIVALVGMIMFNVFYLGDYTLSGANQLALMVASAVAAVMLWTFWAAPADAPLAVVLVLEAVPLLIICGVLYALFQRIREIGKGEIDDAKKY